MTHVTLGNVAIAYLAMWASVSVLVALGMWGQRKRRIDPISGTMVPVVHLLVIAAGLGFVFPLFVLVAIAKLLMPKRKGVEFAPMGETEWAEEMRRGAAHRRAVKVRSMHEKKS